MQTSPRYWILAEGPPLGPFAADEVHAKLAAGELTLAMKYCPVGEREWRSLEMFPQPTTKAGVDLQSSVAAAATSVWPAIAVGLRDASAAIDRLKAKAAGNEAVVGGIVLAAVLVVVGSAIWWLTPLTPRQVVERFVAADTLGELTKYSTTNLHPALRAMDSLDDASDPADRFELTQDRPAPAGIGGHYVGCSFRFRDPETNVMTLGAGYFHLIEADGWKIEDIFFTAVNGEALETPYSIARNYRTLFPPPAPKPTPSGTAGRPQPPKQFIVYAIGRTIFNWLKGGGGGKLLAGLALAVLIGIGSLFTKRKPGGGTS